jgi:hypothetical protein
MAIDFVLIELNLPEMAGFFVRQLQNFQERQTAYRSLLKK